jgi:2-polyprenyl-3-methyl-5-hydroxy-6-metoxy-1,4-benzoquinol methylase
VFQDGVARDGPVRIETCALLFLFLLEKEEVERPGNEHDRDADTDVRADGRFFLAGDSARVHQIAINVIESEIGHVVTYFSQTDGGLIAVKSQGVDQPSGRLWQHPDRLRLVAMSRYVLDHRLEGEKKRLALMSQLLDPMHQRYIGSLGISREARVLEVGCGNGSMSAWMAEHVAPDGQIVALDLDLSLVDNVRAPGVEFHQGDIVTGPVDLGRFDFVTARAVLHHVADAAAATANLVASLRPDGAILLIEPDFLPVSVAEPIEVRTFWSGWLAWSRERGIDYHIGRTLAPRLAAYGLKEIEGTAETAIYNGGSQWADYWRETITELRGDLVQSGKLNDALIDAFLARCADSNWWTQTIAFTAIQARSPGS